MNIDEAPNNDDATPSWYADPPPPDYEPPELPPSHTGRFVMLSTKEMLVLICDNGDMMWVYPAKVVLFENVCQPSVKGAPDEH